MSDVGLRALELIHQTLLIDQEWTRWEERSFAWLGHRLLADVQASIPAESLGVTVARVTSRIPIVNDVRASADKVCMLLGVLNNRAVGSAYCYDEETREVAAMLAHNVHEEVLDSRSRELASCHIVALANAERVADQLASSLDGKVASPPGPRRAVPDDMLGVLGGVYEPRGTQPSAFAEATDWDAVKEAATASGLGFSMGASPGGLTIEVAFGEARTSLIELRTELPHPALGHGLGVFLTTPVTGKIDQVSRWADELNRRQVADHEIVPALGAWSPRFLHEVPHLAYSRFVPNLDVGMIHPYNCANEAIWKALWVDATFHPELAPRSALAAFVRKHGLA